MTHLRLKYRVAFSAWALASAVLFFGCGEDPGMYQGETLTFEAPVSGKSLKRVSDKVSGLDLLGNHASNFDFVRVGALVPWEPFPFYDYWLAPVPIMQPVAPGFAVMDYIHPFYAFAFLAGVLGDDDDGGLFGSI